MRVTVTQSGSEAVNSIKVLGACCRSCTALYENVCAVVKDIGYPAKVEHITDMKEIVSYGVMSVPALVVNDKVVSTGKSLKPKEIERLLKA